MKLLSVFTSVVFCVLILAACSNGGPDNAAAEREPITMQEFAGIYEIDVELAVQTVVDYSANLDSIEREAQFPNWTPEDYKTILPESVVQIKAIKPVFNLQADGTAELNYLSGNDGSGDWSLRNDTLTISYKQPGEGLITIYGYLYSDSTFLMDDRFSESYSLVPISMYRKK